MDFSEYQEKAQETAVYPGKGDNLFYPALGLNGEAGEVAEKVKKLERDHGGKLDYEQEKALAYELGDCLWYLADIATELGYSLDLIAHMNIDKLASRKQRGMIQGEGDNR